ncbi:MAG: DUF5652 family protein [Nanoarchaeota archaeon]
MASELISLLQQLASQYSVPLWFIIIVLVWSLIWKALALWRAGRSNQPIWFIVLLFVNTMGLLEILYIFVFSKKKLQIKKSRRNIRTKIKK